MILLVIASIAVAVYVYATVANYYNYKDWSPLCGCGGDACRMPGSPKAGFPVEPAK
jgi:hypothetical protein